MINSIVQNPAVGLISIGVLLLSLTLHEIAHGLVADRLGDPTARLLGRLTLNPIAHLDMVGTAMLLIFGFGWAKPVPVDVYNLKNPKKDLLLISIAGPLTNFAQAIIFAIIYHLVPGDGVFSILTASSCYFGVYINVLLGIFNLLPFAPLDGYKVVAGFLDEDNGQSWADLERFGYIFLIAFIIPLFGNKSGFSLFVSPVVDFISRLLIGV